VAGCRTWARGYRRVVRVVIAGTASSLVVGAPHRSVLGRGDPSAIRVELAPVGLHRARNLALVRLSMPAGAGLLGSRSQVLHVLLVDPVIQIVLCTRVERLGPFPPPPPPN